MLPSSLARILLYVPLLTQIRCPVLLCEHNTVQCRFYDYDTPLRVRAKDPGRIHSAKWIEQDPTPLWSAHFSPLSELLLEWTPAQSYRSEYMLQSHAARAECCLTLRLAEEELWLESHTVIDVDFFVHIADPLTHSHEDSVPLTCTVSSGDPSRVWESLICACSPEQALVATDDQLVLHSLDHPSPTPERSFTLTVPIQRVCDGSGESPQGLSFHLRGRVLVAHGVDTTHAWTGMPSLTLESTPITIQYSIHTLPRLNEPGYELQMLSKQGAEWRPVSSEPVDAPAALRWARAPRRSAAPRPPAAKMMATAGYLEIWPCTKTRRVQHCVHLHAGPLPYGSYELANWPWAPAHLEAYVNGHPVPVHIEVHPLSSTRIDAPTANPTTWHRVQCVLATPGHTHLILRYSTPYPLGTVTLPAFPSRIPIFLLRVHGSETRQPRIDPHVQAHITYGEAALVTWFDMGPYDLVHVPVRLVARSPCVVRALVLLSMTALLLTLAAVYALHKTSEHLLLRTDMLAMALDIDFADGAWLPNPPIRSSPLSVVAWLQAPWALPE
ncbi:Uncharacterized protein MSYG_2235 [Malassezia sympodialis ATCC 42132]|uniref:Uncharacterized protein n=1 Tax=Malassezia sympodialis (strain ATCC 42132) TaxID=1230383 RepID=A0A1M8A5Z5_MALS4|nr:Uncharacterized protein MSYG_2235 [Malassezia sympodialis ATCC 42132]